ncbi:DMT family transporter [Desulfogranum mediterraneum]|uniref:DMT family transporter n=1 Tax=Desulfogranum mediterraneum TaxID=160661 RepID=UPI0003FD2E42|nr:DMT family transporter [Desulfogranum mediterraneum]
MRPAKSAQTLRADLLLLLVAAIWGFGFVAQRAGMDHVGPYTFNGLRFLLGGCCLIPLALRSTRQPQLQQRAQMSALKAGCLAGLFLFAGATLQQVGLQYTTAGKAGFITGLYVIFVPIIGLLFGQRTNGGTWAGGLLAVAGLYLLSIQGTLSISFGDLLETIGALFWACHVLVLGYLSPRTSAIRLAMIQFFVCGGLSLLVAIGLENISGAGILQAALPIFYGGVISVGAGYTLQVVVQRKAHPAHAAILLSLESPFAALGGWLLLHELLSGRALIGCLLMLAGMVLSQLWPLLQPRQIAAAAADSQLH